MGGDGSVEFPEHLLLLGREVLLLGQHGVDLRGVRSIRLLQLLGEAVCLGLPVVDLLRQATYSEVIAVKG